MKRTEQYSDQIARLYPSKKVKTDDGQRILTQSITFQVTDDCNLACSYCLSGDTKIRMADYSLKSIKDIQLGDKVLGFEEYPQKGKQTKVIVSDVEKLYCHEASTIELTFNDGQILNITPNHKILVRRNSYDNRYDYVEAGKLNIGSEVYYPPYY